MEPLVNPLLTPSRINDGDSWFKERSFLDLLPNLERGNPCPKREFPQALRYLNNLNQSAPQEVGSV